MPGSSRSRLWLLWGCFVARALFYTSFLPLWEGYDEWGHYAFVQALAGDWRRLPDPQEAVKREVQDSLETAPLPWGRGNVSAAAAITHDDYWRLSEPERQRRERALQAADPEGAGEPASGGERVYEALQPPLYYWLMAGPLRAARDRPLPDRVFLLRWMSAGIASIAIPLGFAAARRFFASDARAAGALAVAVVMPELLLNIGRVGNECLALVLYTALVAAALRLVQEGPRLGRMLASGLVLSLGLLTKAYFLTAVPALTLLWLGRAWKNPADRRQVVLRGMAAAVLALAVAGWWYGRNLAQTGTWTGLSEAVMLREAGLGRLLAGVAQVAWRQALDSILLSHVWFGGWSGLQARSWIYHLFYALAALAAVGVAVKLGRERRVELWLLAGLYGGFWLGEAYNVLLIFLSKGVSASMGWYLYAAVFVEVMLAGAGLRTILPGRARRWVFAAGASLFALLDLYTVHFLSIPYYAGLISHRPDGSLPVFHPDRWPAGGLAEVLGRLAVNKPAWLGTELLAGLWGAYLAATALAVALSWRLAAGDSAAGPAGCVDT